MEEDKGETQLIQEMEMKRNCGKAAVPQIRAGKKRLPWEEKASEHESIKGYSYQTSTELHVHVVILSAVYKLFF